MPTVDAMLYCNYKTLDWKNGYKNNIASSFLTQ